MHMHVPCHVCVGGIVSYNNYYSNYEWYGILVPTLHCMRYSCTLYMPAVLACNIHSVHLHKDALLYMHAISYFYLTCIYPGAVV